MSGSATLPKPPRRILLKLSGELLKGRQTHPFEPEVFQNIIYDLKALTERGYQFGLVVGGGNIFRGTQDFGMPIPRVDGDQIGMLATYINTLALKFSFEQSGIRTQAFASKNLFGIIEEFDRMDAIHQLDSGHTVIFAGGTGNPFFTTDTSAALKGLEIGADILLKATKVDGIYSADPKKDPEARHFSTLTFEEVLERKLQVMDLTAITLCRENKLPLLVFKMERGQLIEAVNFLEGKNPGYRCTLIMP